MVSSISKLVFNPNSIAQIHSNINILFLFSNLMNESIIIQSNPEKAKFKCPTVFDLS